MCCLHTTMRKVTKQEFKELAQQLVEYTNWLEYKAFAHKLYGDKVHKLVCNTSSEYNDEGGYDTSISSVEAYDTDGEGIVYDYSLPFWVDKIKDRKAYLTRPDTMELYKRQGWDLDFNIDEYAGDWASDERYDLPLIEDGEYEFIVDLDTPPSVPELYMID